MFANEFKGVYGGIEGVLPDAVLILQACIDDDENLVRYLVTHGATIDAQDKEGWTPLFAAISCNYLPITK